jgi:antitoxin ParD1/3/4
LAIFAIPAKVQIMTTTMNISLPESLKSFVDSRVKNRGYASHSEYLRDLVRKDELEAAKDQLRTLLTKGLESPPGRPWDEIKASLLARAQQQSRA